MNIKWIEKIQASILLIGKIKYDCMEANSTVHNTAQARWMSVDLQPK